MSGDGSFEAESGWGAEPGWDDAQLGLRTCFHGLVAFCLVIGGVILGVVVGVSMITVDGPEGAADFASFFQIYSVIGWLIVFGFMAAGINRWRRVPEATTARSLATQSLWWSVAYLGLIVVSLLVALPSLGDPAAQLETSALDTVFSIVSYVVMAGAILTFQSSLARAATAVGRLDIANIARRTVNVSAIVIVLGLAMVFVARGLADADPFAARGVLGLTGVLGLAAAGLGTWALVDVMRVIAMLRKGILHEISIVGQF
ncbi:MAG: hypothetical protein EP329_25165 [Deltaproteobacteria bacterium]|nr:MAG: hypothetical protein EP329_25165 [Deltaproteobacteria bacterium]